MFWFYATQIYTALYVIFLLCLIHFTERHFGILTVLIPLLFVTDVAIRDA